MNRKYIFSKIAEAEGRQRMVKTKAYGLIGAIILAGAFDLFNVSTVEAAEIKSGLQNTPISRTAITSLTAEQQSQIIAGEITEVPMSWINAETGNVQWITSFTLVYKLNGEVVTVPVEPGTVTPPTPTSSPLAKLLPNTGTAASTVITLAGVGLVGFAGWLAFRNKKSGKIFLVSLCVAGGIATSLTALAAEVDFLSIVDTVSIELSSHFSHTAATHEDWEYVGYIPTIAEESVKETTTTGSVNVKYVDTEGNEINDLYNLVVDGIVSTTTTTTTTTDGVASVTEDTVASGLTYDATTQKPTSITSNGKVYELVQVKDGDVEQGLVSEGTTTVTYIYRHVPQVTTDVKTSTTTGSVNVKYVDTEGNEIKDLYNLVVDGIVSTTTTTTTTTDGVASVTEDTVASGLTYDATTQKPASITYNGKVYELVQVKDGDVEQGLVSEGTTTVTYIYRHVPQVTTDVKTSTTTGSVNVKYVDTEGNEIKDLYNLVVDGIVSTTTTTTTTTDGVASVTEDTVASGLTYDATTQKPTSITSNGKVYELVQVKDGDVEQGLVSEGTTTVTYIYRHVPQVTTDVKTSTTTGSVNVKYVDTEGNEIQGAVNLVTDGVVSTTTTTTTTTDGVASVTEDTVASGLTYDATTQKPASITYNGKVYELVQVKDGDVEQGLVTEGTTTVTYIYQVVPNKTETTSEAVTGTVITRYVDIDTGEEIVSGSTIVDNGIVANTVITTERNAAGEIVYQTVETIPTGLTYDTTSDKTVKNAEIALIQIPVTDIAVADVPAVGTSKVNNGDGTVTISYTMNSNIMVLDSNFRTLGEAEVLNRIEKELTSQATQMFPEATWSFDPFVTYLETPIPAGDGVSNYVATKSYTAHATFDISGRTTSYTFVSVDASEVGAVEEGTTIITYYYRKVPLTIETVAFPLGLESLTVATLPRDF